MEVGQKTPKTRVVRAQSEGAHFVKERATGVGEGAKEDLASGAGGEINLAPIGNL